MGASGNLDRSLELVPSPTDVYQLNSGITLRAMGFPVDMFPVLFAIPRTAGWLAQWREMVLDPEQKIARPRQIYVGDERRSYVPIDLR